MVYKPQKLASTDGGTGIGSYTKGDILVSDVSGKLSKLSVGTDGYAIVADSGQSSGLRYANSASASFGLLSQQVSSTNSTYASYTTAIPIDDTVPLVTEGTQILSATITPLSASSTLELEVCVNCGGGNGTTEYAVTVFDNSNTCIGVAVTSPTHGSTTLYFRVQVSAGATTAQTFKVRAGPDSTGHTLYLNGDSSSRLFGGTYVSSLSIKEYAP